MEIDTIFAKKVIKKKQCGIGLNKYLKVCENNKKKLLNIFLHIMTLRGSNRIIWLFSSPGGLYGKKQVKISLIKWTFAKLKR